MRNRSFRNIAFKSAALLWLVISTSPARAQHISTVAPAASEPDKVQPVSFSTRSASFQPSLEVAMPAMSAIRAVKPVRVKLPEREPSRKAWLILSAVQHGAAGFDAYSTRVAISRGAVEADPLMRPFAHSNAMYFANQIGPLGLDYVARKMQRSNNSFLRHTWWMPQAIASADFIYCGFHNMGVAARQ